MTDIAFIIGCARSGTSILGELLASHDDVNYQGEENKDIWHKWYRRDHHELTQADAIPDIVSELRCHFDDMPGLIVDKCPPNALRIPFLRTVFPEAKFIHIVRDGRDVACSLQPGLDGQWMHLKPKGWLSVMNQWQGIPRGLLLWRTVVRKASADLLGTNHIQIRYEDLINNAPKVSQKVFDFLGLGITPEVAGFWRNISNKTDCLYQPEDQKRWFVNDHAVRVGRYKENMSIEQAAWVTEFIKPELEQFGYLG